MTMRLFWCTTPLGCALLGGVAVGFTPLGAAAGQ